MAVKNIIVLLLVCFAIPAAADPLVRDGEFTLSKAEVEYALAASPPQIRESAMVDEASRYEFISTLLVSKRVLAMLEALQVEDDPVTFHEFLFRRLEVAREFDRQLFQNQLVLPDFKALAKERYKISKNEIAPVPEIREASHILLLCTEDCEGEKETETVASLQALKERILEGESFSDLAVEYSQDPGSKTRGGRLSNGIARNAENVDQSFRDALFELDKAGDISDVVRSRFGFHILKLESITPPRERSFDEVRAALEAEIEKRFRQDAYRDHLLTLAPGDHLEIDFDAFDELVNSM
jgi:peptidyl-prolyl cis-trans isomerase C